jgi:hypothetical protein
MREWMGQRVNDIRRPLNKHRELGRDEKDDGRVGAMTFDDH